MIDNASMLCFGEQVRSFSNAQKENHLKPLWKRSAKEFIRDIDRQHPAAVGIGFSKPNPYVQIAFDVLNQTKGSIPMFLIVNPLVTDDVEFARLVSNPHVDYALAQAKPSEIAQRLKVLLRAHGFQEGVLSRRLPGTSEITKALYNVKSHRLDAQKIAALFGISLRQLAKLIGSLPQTVHKTPDAERLQAKLLNFEHIARGLILVDGKKENFRQWLNAPNFELDNHTPLQLIKKGKSEIVANLVEDTLLGQPS